MRTISWPATSDLGNIAPGDRLEEAGHKIPREDEDTVPEESGLEDTRDEEELPPEEGAAGEDEHLEDPPRPVRDKKRKAIASLSDIETLSEDYLVLTKADKAYQSTKRHTAAFTRQNSTDQDRQDPYFHS